MVRRLALVLSMVVVASGCDAILDHVRENVRRGAGGGGTGAGPTPPPPPVPPGDKPPAKCDDIALVGDETTCRLPEEWKLLVHDLCLKQGKVLVDFSAGGGDCGQGGTRMAKYQCCVSAPTPPPPVTPPPPIDPPPPPSRCEGASEGGPTSCKPPEIWKKYASDNCAAKGMVLTDIGYADDCGEGSFRFMKYLCCGGK